MYHYVTTYVRIIHTYICICIRMHICTYTRLDVYWYTLVSSHTLGAEVKVLGSSGVTHLIVANELDTEDVPIVSPRVSVVKVQVRRMYTFLSVERSEIIGIIHQLVRIPFSNSLYLCTVHMYALLLHTCSQISTICTYVCMDICT